MLKIAEKSNYGRLIKEEKEDWGKAAGLERAFKGKFWLACSKGSNCFPPSLLMQMSERELNGIKQVALMCVGREAEMGHFSLLPPE